jgi:hypothetical protein
MHVDRLIRTFGTCDPLFAELLPVRPQRRIGAEYLDAYKDVATDRVTRAGYRLAYLINLALDPAYQMPAE